MRGRCLLRTGPAGVLLTALHGRRALPAGDPPSSCRREKRSAAACLQLPLRLARLGTTVGGGRYRYDTRHLLTSALSRRAWLRGISRTPVLTSPSLGFSFLNDVVAKENAAGISSPAAVAFSRFAYLQEPGAGGKVLLCIRAIPGLRALGPACAERFNARAFPFFSNALAGAFPAAGRTCASGVCGTYTVGWVVRQG